MHNHQMMAFETHAGGQNLAYRAISESVIEPLSHFVIPENRIDCFFSCFGSFQETLHRAFVSKDIRKKGNILFHLGR